MSPKLPETPPGCLASAATVSADVFFEFCLLHLVRLGQHHLIAHGGLIQRLEHVLVDILDPMARVDQRRPAPASRVPSGIDGSVWSRRRPGSWVPRQSHSRACRPAVVLHYQGRRRKSVPGAARRMRGAGQRVAAGERIDQARFADIGAAGKCHLHARDRRQRFDRGRSPDEFQSPAKSFRPSSTSFASVSAVIRRFLSPPLRHLRAAKRITIHSAVCPRHGFLLSFTFRSPRNDEERVVSGLLDGLLRRQRRLEIVEQFDLHAVLAHDVALLQHDSKLFQAQ